MTIALVVLGFMALAFFVAVLGRACQMSWEREQRAKADRDRILSQLWDRPHEGGDPDA